MAQEKSFKERLGAYEDSPPEMNPNLIPNRPKQEEEDEQGFVGDIVDAVLAPPRRLGENIAELSGDVRDARRNIEELRKVDPEAAERIQTTIGDKPSFKEVAGNVIGTGINLIPIGKIPQIAKIGSTALRVGAEGAIYGGVFEAGSALGEDKDAGDVAKRTAGGAAFGGAAGPLGVITGKGFKKLASTKVFKKGWEAVSKTDSAQLISRHVRPVIGVIKNDFGDAGAEIAKRIETAGNNVQTALGRVMRIGEDVGALGGKMSREESYQLGRALRGQTPTPPGKRGLDRGFVTGRIDESGKLTPERAPITPTKAGEVPEELIDVSKYEYFRAGFDDVAAEAQSRGLKVKVPGRGGKKTEFIQFEPLDNYYPKQVPPVDDLRPAGFGSKKTIRAGLEKVTPFKKGTLAKEGRLRQDVLQTAVDDGAFRNKQEAAKALDGWIEAVDKDGADLGAKNGFIEYLIKSGQADNVVEANRLMKETFENRSLVKLGGSLEHARVFDNPFYNPYPDEVFPMYAADSLTRLENVSQLGVKYSDTSVSFPEIDEASANILAAEGRRKAEVFDDFVEVAMERVQSGTEAERVSGIVRTLQVPKLAFAQILNIGQSILNPLLKTDARSTAIGLAKAFNSKQTKRALESGATLQSVFNEVIKSVGGNGTFSDKFLKATGFTWTEKFNRTVAQGAGEEWAKRVFQKAANGGARKRAYYKKALQELNIDADAALSRGKLTDAELLKAGQTLSNESQFRSRPQDMPYFASHPLGKALWQFKSFIYNQTKYVFKDNLYNEWQKGARGKARVARNLAILSTVFPMVGEVTQDIRSLLTGSTRPTDPLDRYLENIAGSGAWGIFLDFARASKFDSWDELVAGPAAGSAIELLNKLDEPGEFIREMAKQTGVLRPISDIGKPDRVTPGREPFLETLEDEFGF